MLDFIKENITLFIEIAVLILTFIAVIIKRKPKSLDDFTLVVSDVLSKVPVLVSQVEQPSNGAEKKAKVIDACLNLVRTRLGRTLTSNESSIVREYVSEQIELVLSTPQKKSC